MFRTSIDAFTARDLARRQPPARVERAVHQAVAVVHGRGVINAAHVRSTEYVATEALQAVAGLTDLEGLYVSRAPLGEARYRLIADTATAVIANIVAGDGPVMIIYLVIGLIVLTGLCVASGYWWALDRLTAQRARLDQERQALAAEWRALDNVRRVRTVFFRARQAMRQQADTFGGDR